VKVKYLLFGEQGFDGPLIVKLQIDLQPLASVIVTEYVPDLFFTMVLLVELSDQE
jgi:hypothetical protein